jgi:staphylococcal nuclease domain-containing protein 1
MYVVVINIADNQLWADYAGEEVEIKADSTGALAPEYLDVYVSSIKENDPFGFSVQILKSDSESSLRYQADDRCGFP